MAPRPVRTKRAVNADTIAISKQIKSIEATGDKIIKKPINLDSKNADKATKPSKGRKQKNKEDQENIVSNNDDLEVINKDRKHTRNITNTVQKSTIVLVREHEKNDNKSSNSDELSIVNPKTEEKIAIQKNEIAPKVGKKGQNKKEVFKVLTAETEDIKKQEILGNKGEIELQESNEDNSQKLTNRRKRNVKINVPDDHLNSGSKKTKSNIEKKNSKIGKDTTDVDTKDIEKLSPKVKSIKKKVVLEEKTVLVEAPKVNKSAGRGNIENKITDEVIDMSKIPESKLKQTAKGKRGATKITQTIDESGGDSSKDTQEPPTKKTKSEDKKPLKNKSVTSYESIDFSNSSKNSEGKPWNLKISSWNVDGIRAWLSKGGLEYIKYEKPDILCLQEVKCSQDKLPEEVANVPGYHPYWLCSDKDGYAGVGIYTTKMAINVQYGLQDEELDSEGRIITAEYEQFYLICTYVPNAGRKLVTLPKKLKWNEVFHRYVKELDAKKPVIICGDMNVAHNEIDLTNPKTNKKNAGFTPEERAGMTELLKDGFIDTFRHLNPEKTGAYTFWTYMMNSRAKNVGWRLDYLIVSERLLPSLCDSVIRNEVYGSDHCPITLFLHLSSVPKIPSE